MATQEKIAAVSELKELFPSFEREIILTEYRRMLTVAQLRGAAVAHSVQRPEYAVVKNLRWLPSRLKGYRRIRRPPPRSSRWHSSRAT